MKNLGTIGLTFLLGIGNHETIKSNYSII